MKKEQKVKYAKGLDLSPEGNAKRRANGLVILAMVNALIAKYRKVA